jgi:hypothetical protein
MLDELGWTIVIVVLATFIWAANYVIRFNKIK